MPFHPFYHIFSFLRYKNLFIKNIRILSFLNRFLQSCLFYCTTFRNYVLIMYTNISGDTLHLCRYYELLQYILLFEVNLICMFENIFIYYYFHNFIFRKLVKNIHIFSKCNIHFLSKLFYVPPYFVLK